MALSITNRWLGRRQLWCRTADVTSNTSSPPLSPALIVVAGVPAAGKTHFGEYLQTHHGFLHLEFEAQDRWPASLRDAWRRGDLQGFVAGVWAERRPVVFTWGFLPQEQAPLARYLRDQGARLVWFDADPAAARAAFIERERRDNPLRLEASIRAFDAQMERIGGFDVDRELRPVRVETLHGDRSRKPLAEIARRVLGTGTG
jgi:hypothetical protein